LLNYIIKYLKYILTLRYIKLLSYLSAKYLQQSRQESHKYRYTYYYGFQIIYGAINKFILLVTLGFLFNILPQILLVTISFVSLRVWSGGLHFNSYTKCAYISLLSFTIVGLLAKYIYLNQIITAIIFLLIYLIIFKWVPVEHPNRPLTNNEKLKFKTIALLILTILYIINLLTDNIIIKNSIVYGVILSGIITIPIISNLDKNNNN